MNIQTYCFLECITRCVKIKNCRTVILHRVAVAGEVVALIFKIKYFTAQHRVTCPVCASQVRALSAQ